MPDNISLNKKHHIRYFGRFPVSQFNDSLGGVDLNCIFPKSWNFPIISNMVLRCWRLPMWWLGARWAGCSTFDCWFSRQGCKYLHGRVVDMTVLSLMLKMICGGWWTETVVYVDRVGVACHFIRRFEAT